MGTLQQISALVVGEMWGLKSFECPTLGERRLGTIDTLDRWQDGGGEEGMF